MQRATVYTQDGVGFSVHVFGPPSELIIDAGKFIEQIKASTARDLRRFLYGSKKVR